MCTEIRTQSDLVIQVLTVITVLFLTVFCVVCHGPWRRTRHHGGHRYQHIGSDDGDVYSSHKEREMTSFASLQVSTPQSLSQLPHGVGNGSDPTGMEDATPDMTDQYSQSRETSNTKSSGKEKTSDILDLKNIIGMCWPARSKWYAIGVNIGFSTDDLDAIKEQHQDNPDKCIREMFSVWLRHVDPIPTWSVLCSALRSPTVNFGNLVVKYGSQSSNVDLGIPAPVKSDSQNAFKCPCGNNCSLDDYLKKKCQPQSVEMFPYLDVGHLDEYDREKLKQQLCKDTGQIMTDFSDFFLNIIDSMEARSSIDTEKIASCITSIAPRDPFTPPLQTVDSTDSIRHTLISLQHKYITFFNYHILEYIIDRYGNDDEKKWLEQYEMKFNEYCKRNVFEVPQYIFGPTPHDSRKLVVKVNAYEEHRMILADTKALQRKIAEALQIPVHDLCLRQVCKGCVELVFSFTNSVAEAVIPHIDSNPMIGDLETSGVHIMPGPPSKPQIVEVSADSVKLHWSKPKYGVPSIQMYIISFTDSTNTWKDVLTADTCISVNLYDSDRRGLSFRFKVCAVNNIGRGLESEETEIVFLDNRLSGVETTHSKVADDDDANPTSKEEDVDSTGNIHENFTCDSCRQHNISGIRWKCTKCYDFNLCTQCYYAGKHSLDHTFSRIDCSEDGHSVVVPVQKSSKKISAEGLFPNAEAVRWIWQDQDVSAVYSLTIPNLPELPGNTKKCMEWIGSHNKSVYRAGHQGKVDVKCTTSEVGSSFYPDHPPVLGAPIEDHRQTPTASTTVALPTNSPSAGTCSFVSGDCVRVQLEVEIFKMMQEGHGGWNDQMAETLSEVGTIQSVLDSGDIRVQYPSNHVWTMNPYTVVKVEQYSTGDVIRILDDIVRVHDLQEYHGGWVDEMALSLGQVGRVVRVFPTGDIRVVVNGRTWTFNPACLSPAPGENPPEIPASATAEGEGEDLALYMKLLSLLENPAVIVAAAASGDVATLKDYLSKHPHDVNTKATGKAAIHCASVAGNIPMIKAILEFSPDLEVEDEDGNRPLHLCAYSDENEAAKLLIDHGAKVNSTNKKGATPLIIAAVKGHHSVLRILASHPQIKLHEQDSDGETALHCAVLAQKNESVSILLDAGADATLLNFRLFTPIHEAARIGFLPALEHFVRKQQDSINLKKDDGYTALHLASLNDHLDVVTALAEMEFCNINKVTNMGQTALHLSVHQGHARIVERLVGFGIDLNLQDSNGDTALHVALSSETADTLSSETPQLKKVLESFGETGPNATATVACFLIQEGASILLQNKKGHTPLQVCSSEVVPVVMAFKDSLARRKLKNFHGSLCAPTVPQTMFKSVRRGRGTGLAPAPFYSLTMPRSVDGISLPASVEDSSQELCFLCESPVDVKFDPCGHAMMCSTCAQRAKKCPQCKAATKSISKLKVMCPMCDEEETSVTMRPCRHKFCPGCARRMKRCFDCRVEITLKEGLPTETGTSPEGASGPNCAICLTEPKNTAFLCGHQLCWDCAQKVDHCPVCRKFVTHRIHLFQ